MLAKIPQKRKYIFAVIAFTLMLNLIEMPSSQAIFGLSSCEKLKSASLKVEKDEYHSWLIYRKTVLLNQKLGVGNNSQTLNMLAELIGVWNLELEVLTLAIEKPGCFSRQIYTIIGQALTKLPPDLKLANSKYKSYLINKGVIPHLDFSTIIPKFVSLYDTSAVTKN
jgi:hypothetical protein